ncbi:hypothetical protein B0T16DRAFT_388340 [Cercophora newfieldiana]|uniref:Uncharacterized protein n=1 Tax=Cercophora newfieldiana TaxID=92897 RepID=A0AA39YBI7_9PEZI|nr:hypothetical protein B0T16DRAFT_388340 [Cercophora newfieldiana]
MHLQHLATVMALFALGVSALPTLDPKGTAVDARAPGEETWDYAGAVQPEIQKSDNDEAWAFSGGSGVMDEDVDEAWDYAGVMPDNEKVKKSVKARAGPPAAPEVDEAWAFSGVMPDNEKVKKSV